MTPRVLAAALAASLLACAGPQPVRGTASGRPGWVVYTLRDLRVEAPADWSATGDGGRIAIASPDGGARLELSVPSSDYPDERACLAGADERIAAAVGTLERARRHPTRLAGRPGQALEADRGAWHVWALAACDGGVQYRIFLTAVTPAPPDVLEVWRTLVQGARIGGEA